MWLVSNIMNDDYNASPTNSGSALKKKWKAAPISLADLVNDQLEKLDSISSPSILRSSTSTSASRSPPGAPRVPKSDVGHSKQRPLAPLTSRSQTTGRPADVPHGALLTKNPDKLVLGSFNTADGSAPSVRYRGFQRQTPKKKKLSTMKKAVLERRKEAAEIFRVDRAAREVEGDEATMRFIEESSEKDQTDDEDRSTHKDSVGTVAATSTSTTTPLPKSFASVLYIPTPLNTTVPITIPTITSSKSVAATSLITDLSASIPPPDSQLQPQPQDCRASKRRQSKKNPAAQSHAVRIALERPRFVRDRGEARCYCTQICSDELDAVVREFLKEIIRFQKRQYNTNPVKAKSKRRMYMGLHEVLKHVKRDRIKCVIVARNIEQTTEEGTGLDPITLSILNSCHTTSTPTIFSMTRHALGLAIRGTRNTSFSCIGIVDASGAEELYRRMLDLASQGRDEWITQFSLQDQRRLTDLTHTLVRHNPRNETPLWLVAYYGYPSPASLIDRCVATGWRLDEPDMIEGMTPLLVACRYGRAEFAAHALRQYGSQAVDLSARSFRGETPAFLTAAHGHDKVLEVILTYCREKAPGMVARIVGTANAVRITPLMAAARGGHIACVNALLGSAGTADLWAFEPGGGAGVVEMAVLGGKVEILRALLAAGKAMSGGEGTEEVAVRPPLWAARNDMGETPLIVACKTAHLPPESVEEMVRVLVQASVPPAPAPKVYKQRSGKPVIRTARAMPMPPDAAYVNAQDRLGRTAVWWAAWRGRATAVAVLVQEGNCDVGIVDGEKRAAGEVVGMGIEEKVGEEEIESKEENEDGMNDEDNSEDTKTSEGEGGEEEEEKGEEKGKGEEEKEEGEGKKGSEEKEKDIKKQDKHAPTKEKIKVMGDRKDGRGGSSARALREEVVKEIQSLLALVNNNV
ncbi:hypothetical protein BC937DRAFT_87678 [Endogone sp. FLAS-F59071]|nr:hypothetical protein BC937DRAFT_87678 [Endogone sp. FLAS-F59071]|eukprot:RUS22696.1 hypothetical protein BC937DRAFT_87678 [Endogone sp. FLAS-F59071]